MFASSCQSESVHQGNRKKAGGLGRCGPVSTGWVWLKARPAKSLPEAWRGINLRFCYDGQSGTGRAGPSATISCLRLHFFDGPGYVSPHGYAFCIPLQCHFIHHDIGLRQCMRPVVCDHAQSRALNALLSITVDGHAALSNPDSGNHISFSSSGMGFEMAHAKTLLNAVAPKMPAGLLRLAASGITMRSPMPCLSAAL